MKKIFLTFLIMFFTNCAFGFDYASYCSSETSAKSTFSGTLASVGGLNFTVRQIIESEMQKALKKETGSKFKVKIKGFFASNILNGSFKSLSIKSKSYGYNGFWASDLDAHTVCSYNKISYKDDKLLFDENLVLKYSTKITQEDLDKIIQSAEYKKIIDEMNSDKIISSLFKIQSSKIILKNGRIVFKYEVLPFYANDFFNFSKKPKKPIDIIFGANLKVQDNKIKLFDVDLNSLKTSYRPLLPVINLLNPLNYKFNLDENNKGDLKVENVKIEDSKINIDGFLIVYKNN